MKTRGRSGIKAHPMQLDLTSGSYLNSHEKHLYCHRPSLSIYSNFVQSNQKATYLLCPSLDFRYICRYVNDRNKSYEQVDKHTGQGLPAMGARTMQTLSPVPDKGGDEGE